MATLGRLVGGEFSRAECPSYGRDLKNVRRSIRRMDTPGRLVGGGEFLSGRSAQATGGISKTPVVQSGGWPLLAVSSSSLNSSRAGCPSYGRDLKNVRRSIRRMATLGRLVVGEFLSGRSAQATGGILKTLGVQSGGWPLLAVSSAAVNFSRAGVPKLREGSQKRPSFNPEDGHSWPSRRRR